MSRIKKSPEERKNEIIEAALELFSEKGYEATTIQDIAEKMGISQGLCYRYFKSKQEIFSSTSSYYAKKYIEDLNIPIDGDLSAVEKLNSVIFKILAHGVLHNEYEASNKKDPGIQMPKVVESAEKTAVIMEQIIRQGVEEKVFLCYDTERTARFLTFGICFLLHPSKMSQENPQMYILAQRNIIKNMCERVLGADADKGIGNGWERIDNFKKKEGTSIMNKEVLNYVVEKTHELISSPSCSNGAMTAASTWLDAIGTAEEATETKKFIDELEADIMPIDGLIGFAESEQGIQVFGADAAKNITAHAKEIKSAGAKYCDCPACAAVAAILEKKDMLF